MSIISISDKDLTFSSTSIIHHPSPLRPSSNGCWKLTLDWSQRPVSSSQVSIKIPSYVLNTLKKLGIVRYRGGRKNGKRIVEDYHHISQPSWTIERCQAIDVVVSQRKKYQEQSWSRCCAWGLNVSEWYRSVWLRKRTSNQHNGTP